MIISYCHFKYLNKIMLSTVVLKGKHQKKNVSNNPSMDSFAKIYIDSEKLWPKIREWYLFELTLQNDVKKTLKIEF